MQRSISALFFALCVLCCPFALQRITTGFHPSKLQIEIPFHPKWEVPYDNARVLTALNQSFHYLSRGSQSYVFESEDGQWVLKLFRYKRSKIPFIQSLNRGYRILCHKRKKAPFFSKFYKTFHAYAMAHREFAHRTGILLTHLNLTYGRLPKISLQDPLHRTWHLSLDRFRFVLQRKAAPLDATLLSHQDRKEKVRLLIDSFLSLLQERARKGIYNADPNLFPNFGVLDNTVVEIDCGNYRWSASFSDPLWQRKEIKRFAEPLKLWLWRLCPAYGHYLQCQLELIPPSQEFSSVLTHETWEAESGGSHLLSPPR